MTHLDVLPWLAFALFAFASIGLGHNLQTIRRELQEIKAKMGRDPLSAAISRSDAEGGTYG